MTELSKLSKLQRLYIEGYEQGKKDERERLLNVWECIAENYSFSDCFNQMKEELMKDGSREE